MSDLLSGLANLTKQVTSNISTYEIRKIGEKVQGMIMNFTEAENLVREATNEDPWGPTGPQMKEICNLTFQYDAFHQVMVLLWKRMLEDNKFAWRRVYKSLTLLNYLLQNGSERVVATSRDHVFQMRSLEHYKFIDEKGKDQGINIRHRAKIILELLSDEDKLRAERKKAKTDNKERYQGYTSNDIRMGKGGSYGGNSSSRHDEWGEEVSEHDKRRENQDEDISNDYSHKEVNSFQFPEESRRRNSLSPELGFREERVVEDDDGFGDFAAARNTPQKTPQLQTAGMLRSPGGGSVPAIPPPNATNAAKTSAQPTAASFDLLGLDDTPQSITQTPDFFSPVQINTSSNQLAIRPPRPPSGGSVSPQISFGGDPFGATPIQAKPASNDLFATDWTSAPIANTNTSANNFASFDEFGSFSSQPIPQSIPSPLAAPTIAASSGLDDIFGGMTSMTITPTVASSHTPIQSFNAAPLMTPQSAAQPKPSTAKVGNTWAGTGGLIDLDNLTKSSTVKQSLSLNQIQQQKQGNNSMQW